VIKALTAHPDTRCHSIVDERSAAYVALGMAKALDEPVGLSCTSGTAALNYAPALAEAYYQEVSLIAITADRPAALIDQREGQAIRQNQIFANYVRKSVTLPEEPESDMALAFNRRLVSEAFYAAVEAPRGPVHINVPLKEPLYEEIDYAEAEKEQAIRLYSAKAEQPKETLSGITDRFNGFHRIMILAGVLKPDSELLNSLHVLSNFPQVVVFSERTSNLPGENFFHFTDRLLNTTSAEERSLLAPDLLITIGTDVVSKQIKKFLRNDPPRAHWHVGSSASFIDTFQALTDVIPMEPDLFFSLLGKQAEKRPADYQSQWNRIRQKNQSRHDTFLAKVGWSDLKAFEILLNHIPEASVLHLGNSSPVRYAMLFPPHKHVTYYANRGTSGIDGVLSTAVGFAFVTKQLNTVILGELSAFYDSNAFWNQEFPRNLKTVIINNQGGGIFRIIPGPDTTGVLETFFETRQEMNIKGLAAMYSIPYWKATDENSLKQAMEQVYHPDTGAAVLEIRTPGEQNGKILRSYFNNLKQD
jgi:2-succinyl-5-enolpyruvyl-6-hydroxy-3-cyclohexene-1-carboxylate synthase